MMELKLVTLGASRPCARCKQDSGDQASPMLLRITTQPAWRFRAEKRSAQDSVHVLPQAQGGLFWLCLFVTERVLTETEKNARDVNVCYSKAFLPVCFFFHHLKITLDSDQPMLKEKRIIPSVWGGRKSFEHFQRGVYFSDYAFD